MSENVRRNSSLRTRKYWRFLSAKIYIATFCRYHPRKRLSVFVGLVRRALCSSENPVVLVVLHHAVLSGKKEIENVNN